MNVFQTNSPRGGLSSTNNNNSNENTTTIPPPNMITRLERPKPMAVMLSRNRSSTTKFSDNPTTTTTTIKSNNNTNTTTATTTNDVAVTNNNNDTSPTLNNNNNTTTGDQSPAVIIPKPTTTTTTTTIIPTTITPIDNTATTTSIPTPSSTTFDIATPTTPLFNSSPTIATITAIDCKQHNIEYSGTNSSSTSVGTPTTTNGGSASPVPSSTTTTGKTATTGAKDRKSQKAVEVLNPQDFYSVDLSELTYKPDPESNIVIQEGQIEHASLNKLIEELTSFTNYDIHFLHTFMLTFRNFTDKETILKKLEERFNYPPNCPPEEFATFKREILDKIRLRIINSIKYWIESFFVFDFDGEMMQFLGKFIEMVRKSNQNALARVIENTLDRVKTNDSGKVITKVECPEILKLKKKVFSKKKTYSILDYPLMEVARQICLIDYAMFKKIEPKECLNQAWNKEHRVTKAPNISRMIQHFNQFSGFVASDILKQEDHEKRVKCVEKFIELANHCRSLNNFNAVFSIMSGLNSSSVHRLTKTWESINEESKKIREELLALTNTAGNFNTLRNVLKTVNPPCVPYNGVFLTDLTFIEDGSPKYINGLINFGKCRLFAKVIRDIQTYQNTRYNFEEYKELKDMIENVEKLTDDELFNMSLVVEPRKQRKKKAAGTNASASSLKDDDEDEKKPEKLDL